MEQYFIELEVRDYELDAQGVVNNSVYMHYLEHGRHKYLDHIGINFEAMMKKGIYLTNVETTIKFKFPLHSGEKFKVITSIERLGRIRFLFKQQILNSENIVNVEAEIIGVCLNERRKPCIPDEIKESIEKQAQQ